MLDSRLRFSLTADDYARARPGYPAALWDWLVERAGLAPGDRVADIGCGTGLSAQELATRGLRVVGVEPNAEMLARARAVPGPRWVRGEAARTGLAGGAFALVYAAQAFHWFELDPVLAELGRLLRPGGALAAIWNVRADTPLIREYDRVLGELSHDYPQIRTPAATLAALAAHPSVGERHGLELPNRQELDLDGFLARARSASYVAHGVAEHAELEARLRQVFARYAEHGQVAFDYRTRALFWRPAGRD